MSFVYIRERVEGRVYIRERVEGHVYIREKVDGWDYIREKVEGWVYIRERVDRWVAHTHTHPLAALAHPHSLRSQTTHPLAIDQNINDHRRGRTCSLDLWGRFDPCERSELL
jgi:hypothetical protein